jgi:hypothetical protein
MSEEVVFTYRNLNTLNEDPLDSNRPMLSPDQKPETKLTLNLQLFENKSLSLIEDKESADSSIDLSSKKEESINKPEAFELATEKKKKIGAGLRTNYS